MTPSLTIVTRAFEVANIPFKRGPDWIGVTVPVPDAPPVSVSIIVNGPVLRATAHQIAPSEPITESLRRANEAALNWYVGGAWVAQDLQLAVSVTHLLRDALSTEVLLDILHHVAEAATLVANDESAEMHWEGTASLERVKRALESANAHPVSLHQGAGVGVRMHNESTAWFTEYFTPSEGLLFVRTRLDPARPVPDFALTLCSEATQHHPWGTFALAHAGQVVHLAALPAAWGPIDDAAILWSLQASQAAATVLARIHTQEGRDHEVAPV